MTKALAMRWVILTALCTTAPAMAAYKCVVGGRTVYQDAPCQADAKAEKLRDYSGPSAATSGSSAQPLRYRAAPITREEAKPIAEAHLRIARAGLKDPDSARFANVRVYRFESMDRVWDVTCGTVNAKNSYGGYVGEKPFWVADGIFTQTYDYIMPGLKGSWTAGKWQAECQAVGVTP